MKNEVDLARDWLKRGEYEVPERMPNVETLYKTGAEYVSVDKYDEESGRMVLGIMFPEDVTKFTELWMHIANCENDGVKLKYSDPFAIQMLILGPEEYIDVIAEGPYGKGYPSEW